MLHLPHLVYDACYRIVESSKFPKQFPPVLGFSRAVARIFSLLHRGILLSFLFYLGHYLLLHRLIIEKH